MMFYVKTALGLLFLVHLYLKISNMLNLKYLVWAFSLFSPWATHNFKNYVYSELRDRTNE